MFKDLKLYDGKKLKLPDFNTYEEKIDYLKENLFSKPEYQKYYGFVYENNIFTKKQSKRIENRWLGIKRVNSDQINETLKNTLDYLTTYLLTVKNFTAKKLIEDGVSEESYLYKQGDVIFLINKDIENFLLNTNQMKRYNECEELKDKCKMVIEEIKQFRQLKVTLSRDIKKEYEYMKSIEDKQNIDRTLNIISDMVIELQKARKEIKYIEEQIRDLYSDYLYITEWK